MTTYAVNAKTGATSEYTWPAFLGMVKGHDGKYYGIKADGLYLLDGAADAVIDFGKSDLGTDTEKRLAAGYATFSSAEPMNLAVEVEGAAYTYVSRGFSANLQPQRFDVGRGLKGTFFNFTITNTNGAAFYLTSVGIAPAGTTRRI